MTPRTQKVVKMLRQNPSIGMAEIARQCGVSAPYVSKLNAEMGIRPRHPQPDDVTANQFVHMARADLRQSVSLYETDSDKRLFLKGYAEAAKWELELLSREAAQ